MQSAHSNVRLPGERLFPQRALFRLQPYHLALKWNIHLQRKMTLVLAEENMTKAEHAYTKRAKQWL